jgi:putative phosphoribosyl transferase
MVQRAATPTQGAASAVEIIADEVRLPGELALPTDAKGVVLFAHGSGSSRHSPRNAYVARVLHDGGMGTLLFDLLTATEDRDYAMRFDVALLTSRLLAATQWIARESLAAALPIGYFGASTGAAAALAAAARVGKRVGAVVSRGGRPDLAGADILHWVTAPTLLIVGGRDSAVIALNREAYSCLTCEKTLHIVPGATHLFEEPGALEQAASVASDWFQRWLANVVQAPEGHLR